MLKKYVLASMACSVIVLSCKTKRDPLINQNSPISQNVSGTFNENNTVIIPLPKRDLESPPQAQSSRAKLPQTASAPKGLGLTSGAGEPISSNPNIEHIKINCYTDDYDFVKPLWRFWAGIYKNGTLIADDDIPVVDCGDVQLSLLSLQKDEEYEVAGKIYWSSLDRDKPYQSPGAKIIVWYEGRSKNPFKPTDPNKELELRKMILDQKVNVTIEKTEEEKCHGRGHLWTGYKCADEPVGIFFPFVINKDVENRGYSQSLEDLQAMCLDYTNDIDAVTKKCSGKGLQINNLEYIGSVAKQNFKLGWFRIKVGHADVGATSFCLTAKKDESGQLRKWLPQSRYKLILAECTAAGLQDSTQIFSIVPSTVSDQGGRDTFRIASRVDFANNTTLCVGVPYNNKVGVKMIPVQEGAEIRLIDCYTNDENLKKTQFIKLKVAN